MFITPLVLGTPVERMPARFMLFELFLKISNRVVIKYICEVLICTIIRSPHCLVIEYRWSVDRLPERFSQSEPA